MGSSGGRRVCLWLRSWSWCPLRVVVVVVWRLVSERPEPEGELSCFVCFCFVRQATVTRYGTVSACVVLPEQDTSVAVECQRYLGAELHRGEQQRGACW